MGVAEQPLRKSALAALRSERVRIVHSRANQALQPVEVIARVTSSRDGGPHYAVDLSAGEWRCTCVSGAKNKPCAHVHAVQLITTGVPA